MVHVDEPVGLDGLRVEFDDERAVQHAGVALVATLASRLGIEASAARLVRLPRERPGAANAGRKVMALVFAMVLGADSIDDCEVLRAGRTRRRALPGRLSLELPARPNASSHAAPGGAWPDLPGNSQNPRPTPAAKDRSASYSPTPATRTPDSAATTEVTQ